MTGGITQQDGIKYNKFGTRKLAEGVSRSPRGGVRVLSGEELAVKNRALTQGAWEVEDGTAYLRLPIAPMKPLHEATDVLQARTLHAEIALQRAASFIERSFAVSGVLGVIEHDAGEMVLRLDAQQYREKIAPLQQQRGAAR